MPFDEAFATVYEHLIETPLAAAGFEVRRADSLLNQQSILSEIVRGIADADLIIADVTGLNENVMYELGLAHGLGKPTVMITQVLSELPFDLRPYRANEYSVEFTHAPKLADLLSEIGLAVVGGTIDFSNPVQDFAPHAYPGNARATNSSPAKPSKHSPATSRETPTPSETPRDVDEDPDEGDGFLERAVAMQEVEGPLTQASLEINRLTEEVGSRMVTATLEMEEIGKIPANQIPASALRLAKRISSQLNDYASYLLPQREIVESSLTVVAAFADNLARMSDLETGDDIERARISEAEFASLEQTLSEAYSSMNSFADSLRGMPHMSKELTRASRRASSSVRSTAEILLSGQAEMSRALLTLQERLAAAELRS